MFETSNLRQSREAAYFVIQVPEDADANGIMNVMDWLHGGLYIPEPNP